MKKRIISMFIAVVMVLGMIPAITLPAGAVKNGDWEYQLFNDGSEVEITGYTGSGGDVTIPDTLDGYSVTSIGWYVFEDCTSLTSITIPDSVTSIGSLAFSDCESLATITIPDSVTSIGDSAFWGCTSLASIIIPNSVTSIGDSAFWGCESLTSITIPDSVKSIDYGAFRDCTSLASITIPDSVTSIGSHAFYYCTSLASIIIPDSVTSIGDYALRGCMSLTAINVHPDNLSYSSVDGVLFNKDKSEILQYPIGKTATSYSIPDSVTSIGDLAFAGCEILTSITIPDSVTSIGDLAFGSTSLTSIIIPDSVTSIGDYAFGYPLGKDSSKIEGFIIYGVKGSAAETYAIENEFEFREIGGEYCTCNNCEDCGFLGGVYGLGKVRGKGKVEIGDAVEILCYLAKLPSVITTADENAQIAALITPASRAIGKPTIQDAVQILCFLAKLPSVLS